MLRDRVVVNVHNKDEDMTMHIQELEPTRWKVFQCLLIGGENAGKKALRRAEPLVVSSEAFEQVLEELTRTVQ